MKYDQYRAFEHKKITNMKETSVINGGYIWFAWAERQRQKQVALQQKLNAWIEKLKKDFENCTKMIKRNGKSNIQNNESSIKTSMVRLDVLKFVFPWLKNHTLFEIDKKMNNTRMGMYVNDNTVFFVWLGICMEIFVVMKLENLPKECYPLRFLRWNPPRLAPG